MRLVVILAVALSLSLVIEAEAKISSHQATRAEAHAITAAAVRAGFPTSVYRQTAIRVTSNGWAVSTPVARNPRNQGNGVVIYHKVRDRWRETAQGSDFHDVPPQGRPRYGIPPRVVLHALRLL
jgi:hypothetical protein